MATWSAQDQIDLIAQAGRITYGVRLGLPRLGTGPARTGHDSRVGRRCWAQQGGLYQQVKGRLIGGLAPDQPWVIDGAAVLRVVIETERDPG